MSASRATISLPIYDYAHILVVCMINASSAGTEVHALRSQLASSKPCEAPYGLPEMPQSLLGQTAS